MAKKTRRLSQDSSKTARPPGDAEGTSRTANLPKTPFEWAGFRSRLLGSWYCDGTRWVFWTILSLILVMGFARWQTNASRSFWIDEFHSLRLGQYEAAGIEETGEMYHKGFFTTISPFVGGASNERWARTPAVLAMMLGVGFMAILGGLWGGRRMALSAAVVGTLSPRVLYHGGEIRYYAFLFMLGALALLVLELCRRRKGAWALPLGGLTALYAYTIHPASGPYMALVGMTAFGLVGWDFAKSLRPALAWRAEDRAALVRVMWLGAMLTAGVVGPLVLHAKIGEIWARQFGAVLSGKASHAPNIVPGFDFFITMVDSLYFFTTKFHILKVLMHKLWPWGMVAGAILLFRRNPFLAIFVPVSYILYFISFYFVPAQIPMAVKYTIAGFPGLLLLIAGLLAEIPRLIGQRWPAAESKAAAVLLLAWIALNADPAYIALTDDLSHYRPALERIVELNEGPEPPIVYASSMLHAGLQFYGEPLPVESRPLVRDSKDYGIPGVLQSLATDRSVFFGISTVNMKYRAGFLKAISTYYSETEVLNSLLVPWYSVHLWRPRAKVIAIPGRIVKLNEEAAAQLTGDGLKILTPVGGSWRLNNAPGGSTLYVAGHPLPSPALPFVSPTSSVLTLRLEGPAPTAPLALLPSAHNGTIACPGGLAVRMALTPFSEPRMLGGQPVMHFSRSYWAEYVFDVPGDAAGLMVTLSEAGVVSAAFEILLNGEPFSIVAGAAGQQLIAEGTYSRVVPLPENVRGQRIRLRFTFLSEPYIGDNQGTIHEVALIPALPPGRDDNLLPHLALMPASDFANGNFPPPPQDPFWKQVKVSHGEESGREIGLPKVQVRRGDDGLAYLALPVDRETPTTQVILPTVHPAPGSWVYCTYEAQQVEAPQHSLGMFAVMLNDENKQVSLAGFTTGLQGQESDSWCRYAALMPVPLETKSSIFYWQVYRHPEENKPPTPPGSELRFRNFRIYGTDDIPR